MKKYDIVLLTQAAYENPVEKDWYIENLLEDDRLVQNALEKKGFKVIRKDWAAKDFDWSDTHFAIFRTTWDYFHRFQEFSDWLEKTSTKTHLLNPISQIYWNIDKHYLQDLAEKGVTIVPTFFVEKGDEITLQELVEKTNWRNSILKPAVSGGARHTYKLNENNIENHENIFQELIREEAMLLQPFQHNILEKGEVSLMVFGGKFSHAILKVAKKGDFRVQDDFGGTVVDYQASQEEIAFAQHCVAQCEILPIYARVDVLTDNNGNLALVELELIEPELWFRFAPNSATLFAEAVVANFKEQETEHRILHS